MLVTVRPDIVSVATPAAARAEVIVAAVRQGVRAIYAEKALCCSLEETRVITEACQGAGVALNIGTSRRYHPAYRAARSLAEAGGLGPRQLAVAYASGPLLHTHSHTVDTLLFLLGDPEVLEVSASLTLPPDRVQDGRFPEDPGVRWALLTCAGGLRAALFSVPGRYEFELICSRGAIQAYNNGYSETWRLRRPGRERQGGMAVWESLPFPRHEPGPSPTLCALGELVAAMEKGTPTSGGIHIARRQMEVSLAMASSHLRGGAPVTLPLPEAGLYIPSH